MAALDTHRQAEELLPWYAMGRLEGGDRALVEAHLSSCAHCQRQLQAERRMIDEFQSSAPELDSGWARLRGRIEGPRRKGSLRRIVGEMWRTLRRPAVAAIAAMQVAFVAIAAAVLSSMSGPAYVALGEKPAASVAAPPNIIVMFRPDATEAEMRSALQASGASFVGGPTAADAYLLRVPSERRQPALARLGADDDVIMAQPIDGAAQ
jgi:anti-sigma factor RsiW